MAQTTLTPPLLAFSHEDAQRAHEEWGCNRGPAALAACLGWTLDQVRPHLGDFDAKRYMNVSMMRSAVQSAGFDVTPWNFKPGWILRHGLVRIQWGGPWILDGKPARWAAYATHWIAGKLHEGVPWVFDINGGWLPQSQWEERIVPAIIDSVKRADGTWNASHAWEVRKSR